MRSWSSPPRPSSSSSSLDKASLGLSPSRDGGGIRSPLFQARNSWQKLVKRRTMTRKKASASYDLKDVNSLESRAFSPSSVSSIQTDKTFIFQGDDASQTASDDGLPLLYASSPSSSDTSSIVPRASSTSLDLAEMDEAERRWNSLQGTLNEADITSLIRGIEDLTNCDFADLVRTLEYKENELMAMRHQIRHSCLQDQAIQQAQQQYKDIYEYDDDINPSSPQSSSHKSKRSDGETLLLEQEEERESNDFEETRIEEQQLLANEPYFPQTSALLENHPQEALWPDLAKDQYQQSSEVHQRLLRPKTVSWSDSDTYNELDLKSVSAVNAPSRGGLTKEVQDTDLTESVPVGGSGAYGFDVWGVSEASSFDEVSIVFEEDDGVMDQPALDGKSTERKVIQAHCYEGGVEYTLGIRAPHRMPPSSTHDVSTEMDDPFALEERSEEDTMLSLYREAMRKTTSLGAWGCQVGMSMSEAVSSYANNICSPMTSNGAHQSRMQESLFDAMSSSASYSSTSFHNFAEFNKAMGGTATEANYVSNKKQQQQYRQMKSEPKERDHSLVIAEQHDVIEFDDAGPALIPSQHHDLIKEQPPPPPISPLTQFGSQPSYSSEWDNRPTTVLSADSSLNLEALLGATPMTGPGEHFSSASPTAGLTTISKPFGESFDHNSFDRPTSFSSSSRRRDQFRHRNASCSPPRGPGKPPKPLTSPSLARQRSRNTRLIQKTLS
ncbi:hypothetical protein ACA910_001101 [Epithemia clementina (nom. ined.)]